MPMTVQLFAWSKTYTSALRPTPDANAILLQASKAGSRDATFTVAFAVVTQGQTVTGTGSGKMTTQPKRFEALLTFPITVQGKMLNLSIDSITDTATGTSYQKVSGIPGVTPRWTKTSLTGSASPVDFSGLTRYDKLEDAKVLGAETLDGVAVWHIRATQPSATTPTATPKGAKTPTPKGAKTPTPKGAKTPTPTASVGISNVDIMDIYVRQDNSYPIKEVVHTTGAAAGDITMIFTKFDSGVTIDLPKL